VLAASAFTAKLGHFKMADDGSAGPNQAGAAPSANQPAPSMRIVGQYIKDLSFENPGAPGSLTGGQNAPDIQVSVDVGARRASETNYESEIRVTITAKKDDVVTFLVELVYAGLVVLENVSNEMVQPILLIECPRLLFPYARRIITDVTRDGGFPPLMLEPIDFAQLYRQQLEQKKAQQASAKVDQKSV
jgi:preprotein translocase subunit SecB